MPLIQTNSGPVGSPTSSAPLAPSKGGTGIANADTKTITLGGPLITAGAFTSTLTFTATTGVTFPTTGTLQAA